MCYTLLNVIHSIVTKWYMLYMVLCYVLFGPQRTLKRGPRAKKSTHLVTLGTTRYLPHNRQFQWIYICIDYREGSPTGVCADEKRSRFLVAEGSLIGWPPVCPIWKCTLLFLFWIGLFSFEYISKPEVSRTVILPNTSKCWCFLFTYTPVGEPSL